MSEVKTKQLILPLADTSVAPSSMVSASAPSIYSVQALSLLAEVSRIQSTSCCSHPWLFIDIIEQRNTLGFSGKLNGSLKKNELKYLMRHLTCAHILSWNITCFSPLWETYHRVNETFFSFLRFLLLFWTWFTGVMRRRKLCHWFPVYYIMYFLIYATTGDFSLSTSGFYYVWFWPHCRTSALLLRSA